MSPTHSAGASRYWAPLMKYFLEMLCFPPGLNIGIAVLGLVAWPRWRRVAVALLAGNIALLYLLSLPLTATALMSILQPYPALNPKDLNNTQAQAIVVLGAGRYSDAPEYGADTVSQFELVRLRYAVHLYRQSHLPLVLVGGATAAEKGRTPESLLMKKAATDDFGIPVAWTEERSRTTAENAANVAVWLREHGIHRIYLVTQAWHMPRAMWAFRHSGIQAIPAPTGFILEDEGDRAYPWLPSARAMYDVSLAFHEIVGVLWYRLSVH
jgi:uncharacterized SAM-binding protein YcdF (DUF218 family)